MKVEQIYTGCLAQGAYYIESEGEAAIIDPLRETAPYLEKAEKEGAKIKYILETHFHADFVSGHVDLAEASGAEIVFGPNAEPEYDVHVATDGEVLELGQVKLKVLHTPGHTMESSTYLLYDEAGKEHAIFTGDTLFIGDVGRPDLAVKSDLSREDLAGHLFDSLRHKIMPLGDEVVVYPAHGAGSACGKNMSKETWDTLGHQKQVNYALNPELSRADFIKEVTEGLLPPPQYFAANVSMNKKGYEKVDEVMQRGLQALSPAAFEAAAGETGALVLDTREPQDFKDGFIPGAVNIGLNGDFAPWVGTLIPDLKQPILLVTEKGKEEEAVTRLARVGYDNAIGYLEGGFEAWLQTGKETDRVNSITPEEFSRRMKQLELFVADVRKPSEYEAEHVDGAVNIPLNFINENMTEYREDQPNYLHCKGGYRSMITASILKSRGIHNIVEVAGGFDAISKTDVPRTDYVCPTTKK